jgi:hypothetical protein
LRSSRSVLRVRPAATRMSEPSRARSFAPERATTVRADRFVQVGGLHNR